MIWQGLDVSILGPALLAGLLVLSTHVPLGQEVLKRGIIFLDLAVAQIAGLGVIAAAAFGWDASGWQIQLIAVSAALAGAVFLYWCEKRWPDVQEAIIGSVFVLAACAGIVLLSSNPHGGEALKELLAGQILWIGYAQLVPLAGISALVLVIWFASTNARHPFLFYGLFAIAVTASVQFVGVYLVFASLILPALAVRNQGRYSIAIGLVTGTIGYASGLLLSALLDWPSGASIVWTLAVVAVVVSGLSGPDRPAGAYSSE
jgi:zinc/manganese transport system permease protein